MLLLLLELPAAPGWLPAEDRPPTAAEEADPALAAAAGAVDICAALWDSTTLP